MQPLHWSSRLSGEPFLTMCTMSEDDVTLGSVAGLGLRFDHCLASHLFEQLLYP